MNLEEIFSLEERISSGKIKHYVDIIVSRDVSDEDRNLVFDALSVLSEKQWHNFEKLEQSSLERLTVWLKKNIRFSTVDEVNTVLGIIAQFGLIEVYSYLKEIVESDKIRSNEIKKALLNGLNELKDNVSDPWSGMR